MGIVRNRAGKIWSVKCDCCGRTTFYEGSREDAVMAVKGSSWTITTTGGCAPRDYCPSCYEDAQKALDIRRKSYLERR